MTDSLTIEIASRTQRWCMDLNALEAPPTTISRSELMHRIRKGWFDLVPLDLKRYHYADCLKMRSCPFNKASDRHRSPRLSRLRAIE
jgi:hypothetical protein